MWKLLINQYNIFYSHSNRLKAALKSKCLEICIYFAISKDKGRIWLLCTKLWLYGDMRATNSIWDETESKPSVQCLPFCAFALPDKEMNSIFLGSENATELYS